MKISQMSIKKVEKDIFLIKAFLGSSNLDCVHGIRFMSTTYVIIGHRYLMMMFFPVINSLHIMENLSDMGQKSLVVFQPKNYTTMDSIHVMSFKSFNGLGVKALFLAVVSETIIINWILYYRSTAITGGTLCVDTFFMVSGMLVSIGFFEHSAKGKISWFIFYFHRYIRITPPLAIVVLWTSMFMHHFGSGPLWNDMLEVIQKPCQEYWWATILHIQNYVHPYPLCMTQTWYLTCDMQYYFLSPLILVPLLRNNVVGYVNYAALYVLSVSVSFYLAWTNKYNGGVPVTNQLFSTKYFQYHYITPHTRAATYIIGLGFGHWVYKTKDIHIEISSTVAVFGWIICMVSMLASLMGCHVFFLEEHEYNRMESSVFLAISRTSWTLGVVWMVWACINGYGGPINYVLSLNIFRILGKISYGMFLLHMGMQYMMSGAAKMPGYFSDFQSIYSAFSDLFIMVIAGFFFTIFFESPIVQALSLLAKRGNIQVLKVQPMENHRKY